MTIFGVFHSSTHLSVSLSRVIIFPADELLHSSWFGLFHVVRLIFIYLFIQEFTCPRIWVAITYELIQFSYERDCWLARKYKIDLNYFLREITDYLHSNRRSPTSDNPKIKYKINIKIIRFEEYKKRHSRYFHINIQDSKTLMLKMPFKYIIFNTFLVFFFNKIQKLIYCHFKFKSVSFVCINVLWFV